jgi:hypothetical protein
MDPEGRPIEAPEAVRGSVSFAHDGRTLLAQMVKARVVWMGATGVRLEGMEPIEGPKGTQYRAMEWQHIYWTGMHEHHGHRGADGARKDLPAKSFAPLLRHERSAVRRRSSPAPGSEPGGVLHLNRKEP